MPENKRPWTPSKWSVGYNGGITGPTTPIIRGKDGEAGPFCQDYLPYEIVTTPFSHSFGDCNSVIAIVPDQDDGRREANARLIAAAPELYEALEAVELWEAHLIESEAINSLSTPLMEELIEVQKLRNAALRAANPAAFDGEGE